MKLTKIEEYNIDPTLQTTLAALLSKAFPGYPNNRIYFKQIPSFRLLCWQDDQLAGHLAIEHRMINAGGTIASIFGISDLCVDPDHQNQQIGSLLLREAEQEARQSGIDFLVLVASDKEFYEKQGFQLHHNLCRWMSIGEHQSIGLIQGRLPGGLLSKSLSGKKWGDGVIDFLGYMF